MGWLRFGKKRPKATFDDEALGAQGREWQHQEHGQLERLAAASGDEKQRAQDLRSADLRKNEVNRAFLADESDPAEDEKMLADELRTMKRRDPLSTEQ
jgi:hypothetical protein